jgi:hypothetical protein
VPTGRYLAALVDFVVWAVTMGAAAWTTDTAVRVGLGWSSPAPLEHRDAVTILSIGFGAFVANLCVAAYAARSRSPGKALFGLKLVAADSFEKPGWARGLVRSSFQAGPYLGGITVLTGVHDAFAGTRIVSRDERRPVDPLGLDDEDLGVPAWKVGLAVLLHGFFAFVFMMIAAL